MKLTKEQVKIGKAFLAANNKSEKHLVKEFTEAFWETTCNSSFDEYLNWLVDYRPVTPLSFWKQAHNNIMSGKAGASHFS
jgi:hypothetical protein